MLGKKMSFSSWR